MRIIKSPFALTKYIKFLKSQNKTIGLVPTLGSIHAGHISLIKKSLKKCDITVVSIFLNRKQFFNLDDLKKYPSKISDDKKKLASLDVDILFMPDYDMMYAKNENIFLSSTLLKSDEEKIHFNGVLTVVNKLFNICLPDFAFFGKKDPLQLFFIKEMIRDLNMDIKIVPCPTIREKNGLALSSRNQRLSAEELERAGCLNLILSEIKSKKDLNAGRSIISKNKITIVYIKLFDIDTFKPTAKFVRNKTLICIKAKIGSVFLIDNILYK